MSIEVVAIKTKDELQTAFDIRVVVFVEEQKVPIREELDQFEDESVHLLGFYDSVPCATCRWRFTNNGAILERFAVLKEFRGQKIGSALVTACIESIENHPEYTDQVMYLNAQLEAIPLYAKHGFQGDGELFFECDIKHQKMIRK